ncbi:sigma-70 family RNA polymerase sigma factor [Paraconexibacter antarcticus]|uniref:Sigma-70 family RNA polymerase sigma factor n=1 Tax=Paraconexibacter antarcticus TaxID=2949664 RepID=A0ABY5DZI8_9ACTN|nr:sigma-70 family RNA polymerase sigma factor [Paraconexibacter antarcticus]UTI66964.1 sigma-70 family RNA polymerase sigma factor [Paraconexibacter antarcticus]
MTDAGAALERAFHDEWARVLAALARHVGVGPAEEATADAFAAAAAAWPRDGVPDRPGAWLAVTARRRAVDRIRRDRAQTRRAEAAGTLRALEAQGDPDPDEDETAVPDDRLRLIFTCCHPALDPAVRVALTLRAAGGLSTREIARAFLLPEPTVAQRIVRAKRKIAVAGIRYAVPADHDLPDRLASVLDVLYLVFNEGYEASAGPVLDRPDLSAEALRLTRLLCVLMPDEAEVLGLLALMLLTDARRAARVGPGGGLVPLAEQDRTRWDRRAIAEGTGALERALSRRIPGPFQVQAAIAALHAAAPSDAATDWPQIAALYGRLAQLAPSPVVELNRAVALTFAGDPAAGRALLEAVREPLGRYVPLHAADAELHRRAGDDAAAIAAYDRALDLSANDAQRAELTRRRARLSGPA